VAFCLAVDQEHRDAVGEEWLEGICGLDKKRLYGLLSERWDALFQASYKELLSDQAEEPQSYTLGSVALAFLDLLRLDDPLKEFVLKDRTQVERFTDSLSRAYEEIRVPTLAQMSQFNLLPVMIVRDGSLFGEGKREESARGLVELVGRCMGSRVWIREGADRGSWGFNVKNSQALITGLAGFWRHAFDPAHHERFQRAFQEASRSERITGRGSSSLETAPGNSSTGRTRASRRKARRRAREE